MHIKRKQFNQNEHSGSNSVPLECESPEYTGHLRTKITQIMNSLERIYESGVYLELIRADTHFESDLKSMKDQFLSLLIALPSNLAMGKQRSQAPGRNFEADEYSGSSNGNGDDNGRFINPLDARTRSSSFTSNTDPSSRQRTNIARTSQNMSRMCESSRQEKPDLCNLPVVGWELTTQKVYKDAVRQKRTHPDK